MSTTQQPLNLGALGGTYDVVAELGAREGMRSYLARRQSDGANVLVSVFAPPEEDSRGTLAQFAADAKLLSGLEHRNLLPILGGGWTNDGAFAFVTPRLGMPTLNEVLRRGEQLSNPRIAAILQQVLGLLEWAKGQKVVHRRITPDTLYLEPETDHVLAAFTMRPIGVTGVGDADEEDARSVAALAWRMLAAQPALPEISKGETPGSVLAELRPDLPTRVLERTDTLLHHAKDGRLVPDVPGYIASIAMADAIKTGEREIAELREEILEQQMAEREQWKAEREELDRLAAEQERKHVEAQQALETKTAEQIAAVETKTAEQLAAMEAKTAEQLAAMEKQSTEQLTALETKTAEQLAESERVRAEQDKRHQDEREALAAQVANERADMERELSEGRAALNAERTEAERKLAAEREELVTTTEKQRAEAARSVADTKAEAERTVKTEREQMTAAAEAERERFMHERDEALRHIAAERERLDAEHAERTRVHEEERARWDAEKVARDKELCALEQRLRNEAKTHEQHFLSSQEKLTTERSAFERTIGDERKQLDRLRHELMDERTAMRSEREQLQKQLAELRVRADKAERERDKARQRLEQMRGGRFEFWSLDDPTRVEREIAIAPVPETAPPMAASFAADTADDAGPTPIDALLDATAAEERDVADAAADVEDIEDVEDILAERDALDEQEEQEERPAVAVPPSAPSPVPTAVPASAVVAGYQKSVPEPEVENVSDTPTAGGPAPMGAKDEEVRVVPRWMIPAGGAALALLGVASALAIGSGDRPRTPTTPVARHAPAPRGGGMAEARRRGLRVVTEAGGNVTISKTPSGSGVPASVVPMPAAVGTFGAVDTMPRVKPKAYAPPSEPRRSSERPARRQEETAPAETVAAPAVTDSVAPATNTPATYVPPSPTTGTALPPTTLPPTSDVARRPDSVTAPRPGSIIIPGLDLAPRPRAEPPAPTDTARPRPDSTGRSPRR